MPFRALKDVSVRDVNSDGRLHHKGTVLSDWEVEPYVVKKINEGSIHYRGLFEPLTDKEALDDRSKQTILEGDRLVDGVAVSAPWPDYVGLHPEEILHRMKESTDRAEVDQVRRFEKGGQARVSILEYEAPVERPPFYDYDNMGIREVLEKLEVLSDDAVHEVLTYEMAHRKRPAIVTYEREPREETEETREPSLVDA